MTCGCTENKDLNRNKSNILSLEIMKNMSIDEIINLYRQEYKLEESSQCTPQDIFGVQTAISGNIQSLATNAIPDIKDATGYYSSLEGTWVCVLFNNPGSCGWIRHFAGDDLGSAGTFGDRQSCYPANVGLLYKSWYGTSNPINIAYITMYACNVMSTDTCKQANCAPGTTATCTGTSNPMPTWHGIGIPLYNPAVPNPPTNVQIAIGDRQLTLSWTPSNFVDTETGYGVFDYYLEVYDAVGNGYDGYVKSNVTSYTFQNLTNGTQYTCTIRASSRSDIQSTIVTRTGTPSGPTTGTIHFAITTYDGGPKNGFEIFVDGTSAGMTDINGILDVTASGSLSPGTSHSYTIRKTNYIDQTGNVSVISGQTSNVSKIMQPTIMLTSISPASATIQVNTTQQFTAKDQNTNTITTGVTWAKTSGVGSIDTTTGLYSAGPTAGLATISATYGTVTKTASITVTAPPTAMSIVPNKTSCTPPCDVSVGIIWRNDTTIDTTFVPSMKVDGNTISPYPPLTLGPGQSSETITFTVLGLTTGDHTICPDPN